MPTASRASRSPAPRPATRFCSRSTVTAPWTWRGSQFTDWRTVATVLEPTMRAGDRAFAKVRVSWENFRTGEKLMWDVKHGTFEADDADVYGFYTDNNGVTKPTLTNEADLRSKNATDTDGDGKFDAIDIIDPGCGRRECNRVQLESAGKRYALVGGGVFGKVWVGKIFYNQKSIVRRLRPSRGRLRQGSHAQRSGHSVHQRPARRLQRLRHRSSRLAAAPRTTRIASTSTSATSRRAAPITTTSKDYKRLGRRTSAGTARCFRPSPATSASSRCLLASTTSPLTAWSSRTAWRSRTCTG